MDQPPTSAELQQARKAFHDAERVWVRTGNAYHSSRRERWSTDRDAAPSPAEVRAETAYRRAAAELAEARERFRLLQSATVARTKHAKRRRPTVEDTDD